MPTEMELTLEQTQQGVSYEVSIQYRAGIMSRRFLLKLNLSDHWSILTGFEEAIYRWCGGSWRFQLTHHGIP
ncbi:hypothetical protein Tco_0441395 [Tanacetum coccineum]